jgi:hypothetical protein
VNPPTEPIDVARAINGAFEATPFAAIREVTNSTTGMAEARERLIEMSHTELAGISELLAADIAVGETDIEGASILTSGVQRGPDAWWDWFRAWFEPWTEVRVDAYAYEELPGGFVLSDCHVDATGEISGVPTRLDLTQLWAVEEGRVTRYGIYSTHEAAERAATEQAEAPR